jgi:hypothetical protein
MKKNLINIVIMAFILVVVSCKPNIDIPKPSSGSADFSKYIAIGNSLTAGFADGGLYLDGQRVAFPNLLAEQMESAGGGEFTSPFFDDEHANGSGYLKLESIQNGSPVLVNVTEKLAYRDQDNHLIKYTGTIQNLGVHGMRVNLAFDPTFSQQNNYFERLLSQNEVGNKTYFDYATEKEHTFFSFWLGNNDVLGYALEGGVITPQNEMKARFTEKETFETLYNDFIDKLTENGQKGVLATIPDVTAVPFFTTITVTALLNAAKKVNSAITNLYIEDKTVLTSPFFGVRAATYEDLIVLTFPVDKIGVVNGYGFPYGLHPLNPIEDQYVLDRTEVALVKDYVKSYNNTIRNTAETRGLALADIYTLLNKVKETGLLINGAIMNASFVSGGVFSLDGVHLTPKGNAMIANQFIEAINKQYDSKLPELDVNSYTGVKLP